MKKMVVGFLFTVVSLNSFAQMKPFKLTDSIIDGNYLRTYSIYFDLSKATIKPSSFPFLDSLAEFLNKNQNIVIQVARFGDITLSGSRLGHERAKAIVSYLIDKGIYAQRAIAMSYGETEPINSEKIIASAKNKEEKQKLEQENIRTGIRIIRSDFVLKDEKTNNNNSISNSKPNAVNDSITIYFRSYISKNMKYEILYDQHEVYKIIANRDTFVTDSIKVLRNKNLLFNKILGIELLACEKKKGKFDCKSCYFSNGGYEVSSKYLLLDQNEFNRDKYIYNAFGYDHPKDLIRNKHD